MTNSQTASLPRDLPRLTSLRAFAAFAVFFFHIGHNTNWGPLRAASAHGYTGVGFFFILSGFVLTWSTSPHSSAARFWLRRFARVYPSHFVMLLVALVVPVLAHPVTVEGTLATFLLVQAWFPQWQVVFGLNGVSWSLSCEAFFYLITPLILGGLRRPGRGPLLVAAGWFVMCSAVAVLAGFAGTSPDVYAYANPLVRSGEFVLGCLLAIAVRRGWRPPSRVAIGVAAVALMWLMTFSRWFPQSVTGVMFDLPFAMLIATAAGSDIAGRRGLLTQRWLAYLGQVSYAFYLVHELVILNLNPFIGPLVTSRTRGFIAMLALWCVALGCAAVLHHLVEKPAQRFILRRFAGKVAS